MMLATRRGVCNVKLGHRLLSNTATATATATSTATADAALVVACSERYVNIRNAPEGFDAASAGVYAGVEKHTIHSTIFAAHTFCLCNLFLTSLILT